MRISTFLVGSLLGLTTSHASAISAAAASLNSFRIELIDLDPADNIISSYDLKSMGETSLLGSTFSALKGAAQNHNVKRPGIFSSAELLNSALPDALAQGSAGSRNLSVLGMAVGERSNYASSASTGTRSNDYYSLSGDLTVSGRTLAVITMDAQVAAGAWGVPDCLNTSGRCDWHRAAANARLAISYSYQWSNGSVTSNVFDALSLRVAAGVGREGQWRDGKWEYVSAPAVDDVQFRQKQLKVSFMNLSPISQKADLSFLVNVDGSTYFVPPVPEPHVYGMMIAGLAVAIGMSRRRMR